MGNIIFLLNLLSWATRVLFIVTFWNVAHYFVH